MGDRRTHLLLLLCASGGRGATDADHDCLGDGLLLDCHPRARVAARGHCDHVLLLLLLLLLLLSCLLGDVGRVLRVCQALLLHQLLLILRVPRLLLLYALGPVHGGNWVPLILSTFFCKFSITY